MSSGTGDDAAQAEDGSHIQGIQAGRDAFVAGRDISFHVSEPRTGNTPPLFSTSGRVSSPYCGLSAFRELDAPFFFGREDATTQVLDRMSRLVHRQGLLVVSGASGAGKSSLLQAGVLPRLRVEGLVDAPDATSWPRLLLTPGGAPLRELALGVARLEGAGLEGALMEAFQRELKANPAKFASIARDAALSQPSLTDTEPGAPGAQVPSGTRLLLIVDQFEQVFTQCGDEHERRAFISALHSAAHGSVGTPTALVVLAVRADFEERCADYPELVEAVQDRYLVTPMTERQLRLAITGPARAAGAQVENALTEALLAEMRTREPGDAREGVLPLLSHALYQAWWSRTGPDLTLADYESTGGIERAIAVSAERTYLTLTPGQRAETRQVFTRLVAISPDGTDTAVRATQAELTDGKTPAEAADVEVVLEAFTAARLLTLTADGVEISHEALLTAWPLLRDAWLAETHTDRVDRARLRSTAAEWERHSRDSSYLYRGTLLRIAAITAERSVSDPTRYPPLSQLERDFLRTSMQVSHRAARWVPLRWLASVLLRGLTLLRRFLAVLLMGLMLLFKLVAKMVIPMRPLSLIRADPATLRAECGRFIEDEIDRAYIALGPPPGFGGLLSGGRSDDKRD